MAGMDMLELEAVTYGYSQQQPIFESFDWQVEKGETWAVLGPSGCGKTTLLYLLAGVDTEHGNARQVNDDHQAIQPMNRIRGGKR